MRKDLNLAQQLLFLRASTSFEGVGKITASKLFWAFPAEPTPLSRTYTVRLEYKLGDGPDVFVEDPDLEILAAGHELPHVYRDPLRLCLYLPGSGQWTPKKRLDQTVVPWTFTWLYYFEDWLAFGEWRGEGKHPGGEPEGHYNRRVRRATARR